VFVASINALGKLGSELGSGDVMKKLLLASAALAALIAGPAVAADMPVKVYKPAPVYSWTGCYVGGNGGWSYARSENTWTPNVAAFGPAVTADILSVSNGTDRPGGGTVGVQLGCNYQTGYTVWGLEGDIAYNGINAARNFVTPVFGFTMTEHVRSNWLSTVRGRAGWSNGPFTSFGSWMFYFTGGLAIADLEYSDIIAFANGTTNTNASNQTKAGWTFGSGFEWLIWRNLTMKFEMLYVDLGKVSYTSINNGLAAATIGHEHRFQEGIARFGFNYRFDPVVVANY
jgi:outer membrane immunogenic protein